MIEYIIVPNKSNEPKGYYNQPRINWLFLKFITGEENYLLPHLSTDEYNRIFLQPKHNQLILNFGN